MTRWISVVVLALSPFVLGGTAHALRCGTRLVTRGDHVSYVRSVCGEPASVTTREVSRTRSVASRIGPAGVIADTVTITVLVEVWVYDFGPQRFMEELTFEDGTLVASRALSYGTRRSALERRTLQMEAVAALRDDRRDDRGAARLRRAVR